jgi:predicted TPR repeat methyltransferase
LRKLGRLAEAVDSYEHALNLRPAYPEAWCNRAIALLELGEAQAALESCERALRKKPAYPEAACVRANALFQLRAFDAALRAYDDAIAADPKAPAAHTGRGLTLLKLDRPLEALACFDTALLLRPGHAASHQQRGDALLALRRREEAIAAYEQARALAEDTGGIDFALAALGVGAAPKQAPADYVKALFDQYAGHFDRHLTGVLGYRTPALVDAALRRHVHAAGLATVDLGCGTGLCGPFLRPNAQRLAGVDLSGNMLAQARATGLYDELACADIGAFQAARPHSFDLAVAADVLVYFGELDALFAQVRGALRPGGWFCFSTEAGADGANGANIANIANIGYVLQPSNRYAHSLAYLQGMALLQGFTLVEAEAAVVRSENGSEVAGHLLVLRAP